jgi:DNA-binding NarL/FixJ family response regulator
VSIRVLLAEDQTLVRQGLVSLLALAPEIEVVGQAADGQEALDLVLALKPDVLLLDIRMPKVDGLGVLKGLFALKALPPTLILTSFDDDELLFETLSRGAKGFLLKDVSLEQLTSTIRILAAGGDLYQPALTERTRRQSAIVPQRFEALQTPERLTEKETAVLRFLAGGYSNREIGDALGITEGTTKNHISSILSKFGVRDRTRAVLKALELGWL